MKFIAPRRIGRYGRGEIAATGTMIFPYLFVRWVSFCVEDSEAVSLTAPYMYFFPIANPIIDPMREPRDAIMIANGVLIPATIPAIKIAIGERNWGSRSRKRQRTKIDGMP